MTTILNTERERERWLQTNNQRHADEASSDRKLEIMRNQSSKLWIGPKWRVPQIARGYPHFAYKHGKIFGAPISRHPYVKLKRPESAASPLARLCDPLFNLKLHCFSQPTALLIWMVLDACRTSLHWKRCHLKVFIQALLLRGKLNLEDKAQCFQHAWLSKLGDLVKSHFCEQNSIRLILQLVRGCGWRLGYLLSPDT